MRAPIRWLLSNCSPIKTPSIKNFCTGDQASGIIKPRLEVGRFLTKVRNEGDGAVVRRCILSKEFKNVDPFILLDEFDVSAPGGFTDHPHRGFETVTYMLQGALTHQDFAGHKGTIRTGDVQWMTAGRGIVHSEMPGEGTNKGLQLWVNLSSKDKMVEPRYQDLPKENIKSAEKNGVEVRVITGEAMGIRSPVFTRTPAMYLDFILKPEAKWYQSIPVSWNSFVYVIEGEGVFGTLDSAAVTAHHVLVLGPGNGVNVWNKSTEPLRFILIGGQPLNEPVARRAFFVMNTQAEINQTLEDYRLFQNGFEKARDWRSQPI
ncbi:pirin-like protein [Telopea speciosissima]|uniref:pirin-like protein n=1 Tax=Telopea speciosissima TaxID=54955 RepID=UPI001CC5CB8D|nr:pirin-like protein [Telopea speciosissima]